MKVKTNITLDPRLFQSVKDKGLNMSSEVEKALRRKVYGSKKEDVPENNKKVFCSKCKKEISEGYYCEGSRKVWCVDCHKDINMEKECTPYYSETTYGNKQGSYNWHEHIYWRDNLNHRPIEETGFLRKNAKYSDDRNNQLDY